MYIKNRSKYPTSVIKQVPKSISKQLSDLLSHKGNFEKAKLACSTAML